MKGSGAGFRRVFIATPFTLASSSRRLTSLSLGKLKKALGHRVLFWVFDRPISFRSFSMNGGAEYEESLRGVRLRQAEKCSHANLNTGA